MNTAYINLFLQLADNSLILAHRLSENCSKGPFLEEDLAITNVALDHIGLAENLLNHIANQHTPIQTGDDLAFKRKESDYRNCLLVEQPNIDFAHIIVRQFFIDAFNFYYYSALTRSKDQFLSDLSYKSIKEITYHLRRISEWMVRLGNGTEESKRRLGSAFENLWKFTPELFEITPTDEWAFQEGIAPNLKAVQSDWLEKIREILYMSNLKFPQNTKAIHGGKMGIHTEYLGYILCEMQYLTNKYPDAIW